MRWFPSLVVAGGVILVTTGCGLSQIPGLSPTATPISQSTTGVAKSTRAITKAATRHNSGAPASDSQPTRATTRGGPTKTAGQRTAAAAAAVSWPDITLGDRGAEVVQLQQWLAMTGYLPVTFTPTAAQADGDATVPFSPATLSHPPAGVFHWRYANEPSQLQTLWQMGVANVLVQGAVMEFERVHQLAVDGIAGPQVWQALHQAVATRSMNPDGYGFVLIRESLPESLTLWWNGEDVLTSPTNTGIASSPTPTGTWPIYLRYTSQTMSGVNPDGQAYSDPGVPWVNYFHDSDAVHGFVRQAYGFPQSLGCAELPVSAAATAWHYLHYGTLVDVIW